MYVAYVLKLISFGQVSPVLPVILSEKHIEFPVCPEVHLTALSRFILSVCHSLLSLVGCRPFQRIIACLSRRWRTALVGSCSSRFVKHEKPTLPSVRNVPLHGIH